MIPTDEVVIAPGEYGDADLDSSLQGIAVVPIAGSVHGAVGQVRPVITLSDGGSRNPAALSATQAVKGAGKKCRKGFKLKKIKREGKKPKRKCVRVKKKKRRKKRQRQASGAGSARMGR